MRRRFIVSLFCLALSSLTASADDLRTRAIVSYQNVNTGSLLSSGLRQAYDLSLSRGLTEPMTYRIFFRAEDFRGTTDFTGEPSENRRARGLQLQPGGEFLYNTQTIQAQLKYDMLRTDTRNGLLENTRQLERSTGRLAWRPDGLPGISFEGSRYRTSDDGTSLNTTDTLGQAIVDYEWRHLRAAAVERFMRYDDGGFGFGRRSRSHQGMLSYDQSFLSGKFTALADINATWSRQDERARPGGPVMVPTPLSITRAYAVVDDTPLDNRDRPLLPNTALTDGGFNASAGVSLGPDSSSYQNLAFDFSRFAEVDEIRVSVRDASGNPVQRGGGVQWDVYRSEDGILWTPADGARVTFELAQSLYSVRFTQITTRWLKIVSFGVEADPTFVTETQAYYHTILSGNTTRTTDMRLYSGTTAFAARPVKWLSASYNGLYNLSDLEPSNRPATSTRDSDHVGAVEITPTRSLSLTARVNRRQVIQTAAPDQSLDGTTAIVRYFPLRQLDLSVEATRQSEQTQGRAIESDIAIFHVFARLLPSLDLRANIGTQRQQFVTDGTGADSRFVNGTLNAQLTRSLRLLLDASIQRASFDGAPEFVLGLPAARDERVSGELYWRAGAPLALSLRLGRIKTEEISATTQRYRIDWSPFAGGSVSIGGTYEEDIDPYFNRTSRRLVISPRWVMNRHSIFDLNYTLVDTTGSAPSRNRTFYATLTLNN